MGECRIKISKYNMIKAVEFMQLLTDNGSHSANSDNHCIRHSDHVLEKADPRSDKLQHPSELS